MPERALTDTFRVAVSGGPFRSMTGAAPTEAPIDDARRPRIVNERRRSDVTRRGWSRLPLLPAIESADSSWLFPLPRRVFARLPPLSFRTVPRQCNTPHAPRVRPARSAAILWSGVCQGMPYGIVTRASGAHRAVGYCFREGGERSVAPAAWWPPRGAGTFHAPTGAGIFPMSGRGVRLRDSVREGEVEYCRAWRS